MEAYSFGLIFFFCKKDLTFLFLVSVLCMVEDGRGAMAEYSCCSTTTALH